MAENTNDIIPPKLKGLGITHLSENETKSVIDTPSEELNLNVTYVIIRDEPEDR